MLELNKGGGIQVLELNEGGFLDRFRAAASKGREIGWKYDRISHGVTTPREHGRGIDGQ